MTELEQLQRMMTRAGIGYECKPSDDRYAEQTVVLVAKSKDDKMFMQFTFSRSTGTLDSITAFE